MDSKASVSGGTAPMSTGEGKAKGVKRRHQEALQQDEATAAPDDLSLRSFQVNTRLIPSTRVKDMMEGAGWAREAARQGHGAGTKSRSSNSEAEDAVLDMEGDDGDEQEELSQLLGVTAYNQADLEEGIYSQIDTALAATASQNPSRRNKLSAVILAGAGAHPPKPAPQSTSSSARGSGQVDIISIDSSDSEEDAREPAPLQKQKSKEVGRLPVSAIGEQALKERQQHLASIKEIDFGERDARQPLQRSTLVFSHTGGAVTTAAAADAPQKRRRLEEETSGTVSGKRSIPAPVFPTATTSGTGGSTSGASSSTTTSSTASSTKNGTSSAGPTVAKKAASPFAPPPVRGAAAAALSRLNAMSADTETASPRRVSRPSGASSSGDGSESETGASSSTRKSSRQAEKPSRVSAAYREKLQLARTASSRHRGAESGRNSSDSNNNSSDEWEEPPRFPKPRSRRRASRKDESSEENDDDDDDNDDDNDDNDGNDEEAANDNEGEALSDDAGNDYDDTKKAASSSSSRGRYKDTAKDDGDETRYRIRLREWIKTRKMERARARARVKSLRRPSHDSQASGSGHPDLDDDDDDDDSDAEESDDGEEFREGSQEDFALDEDFRVPGEIWSRLYKYQRTAVAWLWELHCQNVGGIVGDEMGLGKTVEMVAFLAALRHSNLGLHASKSEHGADQQGEAGAARRRAHMTRHTRNVHPLRSTLIVCPATVMNQWVNEFHRWWPPFRVAVLHESGASRSSKESLVRRIVSSGHILITTFSSLRVHQALLLAQPWDYVILDEGHKIRNPDAEITVVCKQFSTAHRIILSGSPIQNNLRELWSLFDFVFPGRLGTLPVFISQFAIPIDEGGYANASRVQVQTAYKCACVLRDTIAPYLLRRLKSEVKIDLPDKSEQVLFCNLTSFQRKVYQKFLDSAEVDAIMEGQRNILYGVDILRKICNHPHLVTRKRRVAGEEPLAGTAAAAAATTSEAQGRAQDDPEDEFAYQDSLAMRRGKFITSTDFQLDTSAADYGRKEASGKMVVIDALLRLWFAQGHRVLLFTQTRQMLDIIEKMVRASHYRCRRMDGNTPIRSRQAMIDEYNSDESIFVFLLTTKVGGLGVNLTGADRVVIFDPDWNPSTDTQARERAWRIGQKRQVTVYRLLTAGTIEEKIYHRQIFKQFLTNRVLEDPKQRRFFKSKDLYDLFTLGSADSKETETGALFSGTGSEVHLEQRDEEELEAVEFNTKQEAWQRAKQAQQALEDAQEHRSSPERSATAVKAEIDGHAIDNLVRAAEYRSAVLDNDALPSAAAAKEDVSRASSLAGKGDDYVLATLLKSSVHSALRHDAIVDASKHDYLIVENEANKVAKQAIDALKKSRDELRSNSISMPTWTGRVGFHQTSESNGGGSSGAKPRFGQKKSAAVLAVSSGAPASPTMSMFPAVSGSDGSAATDKVFGNSPAGYSAIKPAELSSSKILDGVRGGQSGGLFASKSHSSRVEIANQLLEYFHSHDRSASTTAIVSAFGSRINSKDSALFKAILKELADLKKSTGGVGIWVLKEDL